MSLPHLNKESEINFAASERNLQNEIGMPIMEAYSYAKMFHEEYMKQRTDGYKFCITISTIIASGIGFFVKEANTFANPWIVYGMAIILSFIEMIILWAFWGLDRRTMAFLAGVKRYPKNKNKNVLPGEYTKLKPVVGKNKKEKIDKYGDILMQYKTQGIQELLIDYEEQIRRGEVRTTKLLFQMDDAVRQEYAQKGLPELIDEFKKFGDWKLYLHPKLGTCIVAIYSLFFLYATIMMSGSIFWMTSSLTSPQTEPVKTIRIVEHAFEKSPIPTSIPPTISNSTQVPSHPLDSSEQSGEVDAAVP